MSKKKETMSAGSFSRDNTVINSTLSVFNRRASDYEIALEVGLPNPEEKKTLKAAKVEYFKTLASMETVVSDHRQYMFDKYDCWDICDE